MTPAKTAKRRSPRKKTAEQTTVAAVALIPGLPTGTILTQAAGSTRVEATLAGKGPLDINNHIIQNIGNRIGDSPRESNHVAEGIRSAASPAEGGVSTEAISRKNTSATEGRTRPPLSNFRITPQTPFGEGVRASFSQREGEGGSLIVEVEVMALDLGCMGRAVEAVMRRISGASALLDAALEMRAVREAEPEAASEEAVSALSRDLSYAGFPVYTGVLWSPSPGGEVWLGVGEGEEASEALRAFVEAHPVWRVL